MQFCCETGLYFFAPYCKANLGVSFIGFFTEPVGEISDSVLWYFAQTLIYAGSVFGLKAYVDKMLSSGNFKRPGEG